MGVDLLEVELRVGDGDKVLENSVTVAAGDSVSATAERITLSTALDALDASKWAEIGLTVDCCARPGDQSTIGILTDGFISQQCHAMACWQSPQCELLLRQHCADPARLLGTPVQLTVRVQARDDG